MLHDTRGGLGCDLPARTVQECEAHGNLGCLSAGRGERWEVVSNFGSTPSQLALKTVIRNASPWKKNPAWWGNTSKQLPMGKGIPQNAPEIGPKGELQKGTQGQTLSCRVNQLKSGELHQLRI